MAYQAFDLAGKVALVTGGNGGIGLGMAEALATAGAKVAIWGSNPAKNEVAQRRLEATGMPILARRVDVRSSSAVAAGMAEIVETFGRVDCVIANAGFGGAAKPYLDTTDEDVEFMLAVNVAGVFYTLREACRHMAARARVGDPGGSLVAVGSIGAESGMPRFQAYSASKGALPAMMRAIVVEHSRDGVRCNTIQPGFVHTDMTDHFREDARAEDWILKTIPQRRWGRPEDFGGAAVYLASDASAYMSGCVLNLDGGFLAS